MYFHALYAGTVPWAASNGSLLSVTARASPTLVTGDADPPRAGTMPFAYSPGFLVSAGATASGAAQTGQGYSFPCGPYHAGEEVA